VSSVLHRSRGRRFAVSPGVLFTTPAIVLLVAFFVVPLVLTVVMSLFNWPLFGTRSFGGADNYLRMLADPAWRQALGFTAMFTVATTAGTILLGLALALLLATPRPGTAFFRTVYFLPVVVGMAAACFIWIFLLNGQAGPTAWLAPLFGGQAPLLLDSQAGAFGSIVVMTIWKSTGFAMLLFMLGLQAIPSEIHEASAIDGANYRRRLRYVTLPLLRPTFAIVLVLQVTQNFLAFDQFFLLTKGGPSNSTITAVYWVYNKAFVNFQLGYGATLALVILVLLVIINVIQLRITAQRERYA